MFEAMLLIMRIRLPLKYKTEIQDHNNVILTNYPFNLTCLKEKKTPAHCQYLQKKKKMKI